MFSLVTLLIFKNNIHLYVLWLKLQKWSIYHLTKYPKNEHNISNMSKEQIVQETKCYHKLLVLNTNNNSKA